MFNFIAAALMTWLVVEVLIAPGQSALETRAFRPKLWLPTLADLAPGDAGGAPLNPVALLALIAAAFYWVLLRRTPLGYEIRAVGLNARAACPPASGCHGPSCWRCAAAPPSCGVAGVRLSMAQGNAFCAT